MSKFFVIRDSAHSYRHADGGSTEFLADALKFPSLDAALLEAGDGVGVSEYNETRAEVVRPVAHFAASDFPVPEVPENVTTHS